MTNQDAERRTDRDFVHIVGTDGEEHIFNIRQIVRLRKKKDSWEVVLAAGRTVTLDGAVAEHLIKRLPGMSPTTATAP